MPPNPPNPMRRTRTTEARAAGMKGVAAPDPSELDIIKPLLSYMVEGKGDRARPAHEVREWIEDGGVIAVLEHWKSEELDKPDRYDFLKTTLGDVRDVNVLRSIIGTLTELSMSPKNAEYPHDAGVRQRMRWAEVVRALVEINPNIPGSATADGSRFNTEWKHKAAWSLLFTALMDLHRDPTGYFGRLLPGVPVEKFQQPSQGKTSPDVTEPFNLSVPLKGKARWMSEAVDALKVDAAPATETSTESVVVAIPEMVAGGGKRRAFNRRAGGAGKQVQDKRTKKTKQNKQAGEKACGEAPPPFYHRARQSADASSYKSNRIGDGPKRARSTSASGSKLMESRAMPSQSTLGQGAPIVPSPARHQPPNDSRAQPIRFSRSAASEPAENTEKSTTASSEEGEDCEAHDLQNDVAHIVRLKAEIKSKKATLKALQVEFERKDGCTWKEEDAYTKVEAQMQAELDALKDERMEREARVAEAMRSDDNDE